MLAELTESVSVFEPDRLKEVIRELGEKRAPIAKDSRLKDIKHTLTLVDGSLLAVLPWLSRAMLQEPTDQSKVRLHTHFEVDRHVPTRIDVTAGTPRGDDERAVMRRSIEADRLYVMDRGYAMFKLFIDPCIANERLMAITPGNFPGGKPASGVRSGFRPASRSLPGVPIARQGSPFPDATDEGHRPTVPSV